MTDKTKFYGKYRGTVTTNVDPMKLGRIMATVPDVHGFNPSTWALPCVPVAGVQMGFYAVPPMGANVWIEFEQGDIDHPIWVGCFWGSQTDMPGPALLVTPGLDAIILQTTLQNTLSISDMAGPTGGIAMKTVSGAMILINETGITLSNGQGATILLTGPTVSINQTALTVT